MANYDLKKIGDAFQFEKLLEWGFFNLENFLMNDLTNG